MTCEEFSKLIREKDPDWDLDSETMPYYLNAHEGLNILIKHFLGDDWYALYNNIEQVNAEAVYDILMKYPRGKIRRIK